MPVNQLSRHRNQIPSHQPGLSEFRLRVARHAGDMHIITLESCHSTWIFDTRQLPVLSRLAGNRSRSAAGLTEWRPYWELEIDPHGKSFTVILDERRTRLIRSSIHTSACVECGGSRTSEVSLKTSGTLLPELPLTPVVCI